MRHQLSLLSATRSSLTRIVSATRSTSRPSSTEATSLRLMSFLHGSDWSPTHVLPPRKRLCNRQDTFLVSHGIIPVCLLHSNGQLNSIPRWSGQKSDFSCGHSSNTFHHSCSAPLNELCVMAFTAISSSLVFNSVKRAVCDESQQFHQPTESSGQRSLPR